VDTWPILDKAVLAGKITGLPRIQDSDLIFHYYNSGDLKANQWKIYEPYASSPIIPSQIIRENTTLLLVPGLAFDRGFNRLGKGKGFYDRTISGFKRLNPRNMLSLGLCFQGQLVDKVPVDSWDITLDGFVTERELVLKTDL
jgi:5-formyltetrahydrofolate cyclo-ligase